MSGYLELLQTPEQILEWERALGFFPEPMTLRIAKVEDYLYNVCYPKYDWVYSDGFFKKYKHDSAWNGQCSAVRHNDWFGRNYDWLYNNAVEFMVRVPAVEGRHASIGMACVPETLLDRETVESGTFVSAYRILPFFTLDGVNDRGLTCSMNVVPSESDMAPTTGTNKDAEDLCAISIPRFLLDRASNVKQAIAMLKDRNVFCPKGTELHFLVSDQTRSVVVEFVNNKMVVLEGQEVITNFYTNTPMPTPHSNGMERYKLLEDGKKGVKSVDDMIDLMKSVDYTRLYDPSTSPYWYSDFAGVGAYGDLKYDDPPSAFSQIVADAQDAYNNRDRNDPKTWHSVHSAVYDIPNRTLSVRVQEEAIVHRYRLSESEDYSTLGVTDIEFPSVTFGEARDAIAYVIEDAMRHKDPRVFRVVDRILEMERKVMDVRAIVAPDHFYSDRKIRFAIDEAAEKILSYTNRRILPKELYHTQCRMAADILLYLTPDVDWTDGKGADGSGVDGKLKRIREDDIELEAQDADDTYVLSLSKNNPNMDFLKDYYKVLEMWRVMPRYRRPPIEPRPLIDEPLGTGTNPDAKYGSWWGAPPHIRHRH